MTEETFDLLVAATAEERGAMVWFLLSQVDRSEVDLGAALATLGFEIDGADALAMLSAVGAIVAAELPGRDTSEAVEQLKVEAEAAVQRKAAAGAERAEWLKGLSVTDREVLARHSGEEGAAS